MSLSANIQEKAALIWAIADKLTGVYKPHEYGEAILPLTVLRRFDCTLADTKDKVLAKNEYSGMTVTSVMGCGNQKSSSNEFEELNVEMNLLPKVHVMTVVWDEDLDMVVFELQKALSTGNVGDGKIFVSTVDEGIRIRTGERGDKIL